MTDLPESGIKRLVDLERLRARRRTLKRLLLGSGLVTGAGVIHAQQSSSKGFLPSVHLLLQDDELQCDAPENSNDDAPTTPETVATAEFLLNETSYTGTASRQFVVNLDNDECGPIVTATASVCMEVKSSTSSEAVVDIDLIIILEGLSAIDPSNDDPAVEYYIRRDSSTPEAERLLNKSITINEPNEYRARTGKNSGSQNSCGFLPVRIDYSLRIENNRPIMTLSDQVRDTEASATVPAVEYTVPAMQVNLASGDCAHPTRFNSACVFKGSLNNDGDDDDVGIIILTTPDPSGTGGPIG